MAVERSAPLGSRRCRRDQEAPFGTFRASSSAREGMMDRTTYTVGENVFRNYHWRGFRYRSDVIDTNYMRRWTIETPLGQIRLHHILRSDNDRHYHDHPFDFVSLILSGGYIEHRPNQPQRLYLPKSVLVRKAKDLH